jgi:hypothetical protein
MCVLQVFSLPFGRVGSRQSIDSNIKGATMNINAVLDRIDTREFSMPGIAIASGNNTIRNAFLITPEVRYLIAHSKDAIPDMLKRLDAPAGIHQSATRIIYFIVFEQSKDPRVIPALVRYLNSLQQGEQAQKSFFFGDPFPFAIAAIRAVAPHALPASLQFYDGVPTDVDVGTLFQDRHVIARKLMNQASQAKLRH